MQEQTKFQNQALPDISDKELGKKLKKKDSYGYKKLQAEQHLIEALGKDKVLSLRLADVIGPYDDSCRFWKYLTWSEYSDKVPLQINPHDHI